MRGRTNWLLHREENWQDRVFNKCLRKAVKKRLREIGNECMTDPDVADDCDELGEEAAHIIVQDSGLCQAYDDYIGPSTIKQFQRACRREAKDVCETSIRDELEDCGADSSLGTIKGLKRKCRGEIRDLTGGRMLR